VIDGTRNPRTAWRYERAALLMKHWRVASVSGKMSSSAELSGRARGEVSMIDCLLFGATVLAVLGSGLIAGVFFGFAAFMLKAISRLPVPQGIAAMQSITTAIKNSLFLLLFFATAALAGVLALAAPFNWSKPGSAYLLLGSLLFLSFPFGVTLLKNVPLNNRLATVKPESAEGASYWEDFRASWTLWNHLRWLGALAAMASLLLALVKGSAPLLSPTFL
jgi:uncharacterized membrane protein